MSKPFFIEESDEKKGEQSHTSDAHKRSVRWGGTTQPWCNNAATRAFRRHWGEEWGEGNPTEKVAVAISGATPPNWGGVPPVNNSSPKWGAKRKLVSRGLGGGGEPHITAHGEANQRSEK